MSNINETPLSPEQVAQSFLTRLRALVQEIPGYTILSEEKRRKLTSKASLPERFLNSVAVSMDALPELSRSAKLTGAEARYAAQFRLAFLAVADEMDLLAAGVRHTVLVVCAEIGERALRAYGLAKSINRPADHEALVPHVLDMRRTLGRARTAREKPPAVTPPVPVFPSATPPEGEP